MRHVGGPVTPISDEGREEEQAENDEKKVLASGWGWSGVRGSR